MMLLVFIVPLLVVIVIALWWAKKRRGSRTDSVSTAPVPTFRIIALGVSGAGKTVLLASMFHKLSFQAEGRAFHLETELEQRVTLSGTYSTVADPSRPWPRGTRTGETREFLFDCVGFDESGGKHRILQLGYLDYAGELLESEQEPGGTALDDLKVRIKNAHALLGVIDGYRVRQLMLNEPAGWSYFEHSLRPLFGELQSATCPIHLVITKWDLVRGFGEAPDAEDNDRLGLVAQALMAHEHISSLVSYPANRIVRLIPVSAVGNNFVEVDLNGKVVKRPDGRVRATNVEVPLCAVLPDLFRQVQMSLDDSARTSINSEIRKRMRLSAGEFGSALAYFLARPVGAALRGVTGSIFGKDFGNEAVNLFLDWTANSFREKDAKLGNFRDEQERCVLAAQQARAVVLKDFERAVLRLEALYPTSLLTRRWSQL